MTYDMAVTSKRFLIGDRQIGYIVRGKPLPFKDPRFVDPIDNWCHVECLLPNGHIAGYSFTEDIGNAGYTRTKKPKCVGGGVEGTILGMNDPGDSYVQLDQARRARFISKVVIFEVSKKQAIDFTNYWQALGKTAPGYNKILNNCSTMCYKAFKEVRAIPQLMTPITPVKLYKALKKEHASRSSYIEATGLFAIEEKRDMRGRGTLIIEEYV